MFYYQCKRCNFISKQKNDMKRHLDKKNKCENKSVNILEKTDIELYNDSLIKIYINEELSIMNNDNKINIMKKTRMKNNENYICKICNKIFHNKSNLNKHASKNICENIDNNKNIGKKGDNALNETVNESKFIQNIGVQNNIININIGKQLVGFDEEWNTEYITNEKKEKILLSNKKFTNTLENILENENNLNVILKNDHTGLVYKTKKNEYEALPLKNIFEEAMDKIYKHLRDFFKEIIGNNTNDIRINILEKEMNEIDSKYTQYKKNIITNNSVNNCLSNIFDDKKEGAIKNLINVLENKKYHILNLENNEDLITSDNDNY